MADHLSKSAVEQFRRRELHAAELARIVLHLEDCPECFGLWREEVEGREGGGEDLAWNSLDWLRSEHLGDGEVARYVGGKLEEDEREMMVIHLRQCRRCEEDVRSFAEHRRSEPPGSQGWAWKPSWLGWPTPARLVYVLLAAALLVALFWWLRSVHPATPPLVEGGPTPTPTANPPIQATPDAWPERRGPRASETLLALRDGGRAIVLDRRGRLTGLEEVTGEQRRWIRQVLRTGELPRPAILDDLGETEPVVRGEEQPSSEWRLLSPAAEVIEEVVPVLTWEPDPEADGYHAEIVSLETGRRLVSPRLSAATSSWTPEEACHRGGTYLARVRAVSGEVELSSRESKFRLLDEREWRKINHLRSRTRSRLALGLSYARAGLISQARRELQLLAEENQDSLWLHRLLLRIRGM